MISGLRKSQSVRWKNHRNPTKCRILRLFDNARRHACREAVGYTTGYLPKDQQGLSLIDFSNFPTTKKTGGFCLTQNQGMKNHEKKLNDVYYTGTGHISH